MRVRARRGFVLAVVLALSVVIGLLVFAYYQSFRHRDTQVRLSSDRAAARWLARASIDCLKLAFHEAPDPSRLSPPDLENGTLLPFLLGDAKSLPIRFAKKVEGKADHRAIIEQLVGADALAPIDRLVSKLPEAKVTFQLTLTPREMWQQKAIADQACKTVEASYKVTAYVRKASESYRTTDVIDVYSLLPPVVSKFTFAATESFASFNTHKVTVRGEDAGGTAPVVLMHSPDDGDPVAENPFEARPTAQKAMQGNFGDPAKLLAATADRGLTFLPGTPESPVTLQLASGGTPFGEYHSVQPVNAGRTSYPQAAPLKEQPPKLKGFKAPDPRDPTVLQSGAVQGAVFGFFDGIDQQELLGAPPPGAAPDMCSQLKPFGTGTHPSAGAIVGHVNRAMAAISDIGIDRDDSSRDEADQQASTGRPLPVRDGVDPFLRSASEAEFRASVANEAAGRLIPFGSLVPNENALVDLDGDGRKETVVASEALHNPFPISGAWKYGALFENHAEYAQVMSRYVSFPANWSLHVATQPADRARELIGEAAFGKAPPTRDWTLGELRLEARDTFHAMIAERGGSRYLIDTKEAGMAGLAEAISAGARARYPAETTYMVRGQAKFQEIFMPGGQIDLQGLKVMVVRETPEDRPGLEFDGEVAVKPGSGGTLITERFKARALKNPGTGSGYAPFVLQAQELVMAGKGPFEGVIVPGNIVQERVSDYTVIRGSLAVGSLPGSLANPLVVQYDPRNDPTTPEATQYYRAHFRRDARAYELEDRQ